MKQFLRPTLTAAAMAVALGMTASVYAQAAKPGAAAAPVDKAKASYVVGWEIASQVPPIMRDELDAAAVGRAVQAALSGQKPTMSDADAKQVHDARESGWQQGERIYHLGCWRLTLPSCTGLRAL
ncbi:MAG: hypothetical protein WDW38_008789 [Sanguina aurantia]